MVGREAMIAGDFFFSRLRGTFRLRAEFSSAD